MQLEGAVDRAVEFLLRSQRSDGRFCDYDLPVGVADAWVTAVAGLALAAAGRRLGNRHGIAAAENAADWLFQHRAYPAGWGFNERTGPDADSTAHAILLLSETHRDVPPADIAWLLAKQRPDGGFATYDGPDRWAASHPDVTPIVYLALPATEREKVRDPICASIMRARHPDGTWPAYWWRTCHYSTYWNLVLLDELGMRAPAPGPVVSESSTHAVHTTFDLAYVTGIAHLSQRDETVTGQLEQLLLKRQNGDGSWSGGPNLRVTDSNCAEPWIVPRGQLYTDINNVLTTATCVRVLSQCT